MSETVLAANDVLARLDLARRSLEHHDFDIVIATPGTNFRYLSGINAHRMERLVAFALPADGDPFLVCPAFEEDNMRRGLASGEVLTWNESDDPFALLADAIRKKAGPKARIGLEPTTWFWMVERMRAACPGVALGDGGRLFDALRSRKSPEEIAAMRTAADIADNAARKARLHLRPGMTELEAAAILMDLVKTEGAAHEPLVQFGANSAIPHAMAGGSQLRRDDMVLFDLSATVDGYLSDLTRMTVLGDATPEMKEVYGIVYEAQQAAIAAIRPGVPCQEIDRAARKVITKAGYGQYFTHRTGHGLGMDIHEAPYLVEGNTEPLTAGAVVTVEPGIYIPGKFGVRIEEDVLVTDTGADLLSDLQPQLVEMP